MICAHGKRVAITKGRRTFSRLQPSATEFQAVSTSPVAACLSFAEVSTRRSCLIQTAQSPTGPGARFCNAWYTSTSRITFLPPACPVERSKCQLGARAIWQQFIRHSASRGSERVREGPRGEDPRGEERRGEDPRGEGPRGEERRGSERRGEERRGEGGRAEERRGEERKGEERSREERRGSERKGEDPRGVGQ